AAGSRRVRRAPRPSTKSTPRASRTRSTCKRFWTTRSRSSATRSTGATQTLARQRGKGFPLGATLAHGGTNFSVFAKHSTAAQLLMIDAVDAEKPSRVINLDPRTNRTYHYWHVFVPGVAAGQIYGYRISGPFDPRRGLRFDPEKVLLDPYGK